jgi:glycine cleavage system H protein
MNVPSEFRYTKSHEWVLEEGKGVKVGITDYAQEALGDLVYVELPEVGDTFRAGDSFAVVESVKATSDVVAPADGRVAEVNETVADSPEAVNEDCYGAWLVKLEDVGRMDGLLSAAEYEVFLEEEEE